jgi:hypothetical protein
MTMITIRIIAKMPTTTPTMTGREPDDEDGELTEYKMGV